MAPPRTPPRHWLRRWIELAGAVILFALAAVIGPLPGPGGIFFFAGGLVLLLRNSRWAQRRFARAKRRWPRAGDYADRALRRPSARRRHALRKGAGPR